MRSPAGPTGVALLLLLAGCSSTVQPRPDTAASGRAYLAIAEPANRVLDKSFDALEDDRDPTSARAELRVIAATERTFDRELIALKLPAPMSMIAAAMVTANEARARLTIEATGASTSAELDRYKTRLEAMNGPVEVQVRALRRHLHLPPPSTD